MMHIYVKTSRKPFHNMKLHLFNLPTMLKSYRQHTWSLVRQKVPYNIAKINKEETWGTYRTHSRRYRNIRGPALVGVVANELQGWNFMKRKSNNCRKNSIDKKKYLFSDLLEHYSFHSKQIKWRRTFMIGSIEGHSLFGSPRGSNQQWTST